MVAIDELKARFPRASKRVWTSSGPHAMSYRPEIDGLRALAVLAVMLFHAEIPGFGGGYVGVDVFFVISGFLITTIIMTEMDAERFSLVAFYTRRVRRIIPALAFVVLACLPVAWFVMLPHELKEFSKALFAVATFTSDLLFWLQEGYFSPNANLNPLLHTWSLAVEEQFYVVFPVFVLLLCKLGKRAIAPVFLLLLLASIAAAQFVNQRDPVAAFFLTPCRIWELLAGALATRAWNQWSAPKWAGELLSSTGILLVLGSIVLINDLSPTAGLSLVPVIAGTVLLLLFAVPGTLAQRCLATPMLVGIGLISYSLYLWHQPLLAFARIATLDQLSLLDRSALVAAAFPLAVVSWALVEKPFRDRRRVKTLTAWATAAGFTVASMGLGYAGFTTWGFYEVKLGLVAPDLRRYVINRSRELDRRNPVWESVLAKMGRPWGAAAQGKRLLILGDSKAEDIAVALALMPQTFPGLSVREVDLDDPCMKDMVRIIRGQQRVGDVPNICRIDISNVIAAKLIPASDTVVLAATWQEQTYMGGAAFADELRREGKRVIVVGTANFNDPASLSMRLARDHINPNQAEHYFWENRRSDAAAIADELRIRLLNDPGIEYHSAYDIYCDDHLQVCKLYDDAGRPLLFDYGHLTIEGAHYMAQRVSKLGWFDR